MKERLGHYDIVAELGRGGMGVVYKGYEPSLNRYVAIKVLADSLAHDESVKERFLREARSMAALNDPHIIQIFYIGEDEGQTYFVMEFVEGESLGSMLKREGKLSIEQSAKVIHQTALGLTTAHDRGVVHRDIKPGNLMINNRGAVKIADFGIALSSQDISKKLTSTGEFVGTPGYLSPEVCLGKPVDQRSDIFSLGIVMFEMMTGKMPFTDESPLGLMLEVVRAEIPDVRQLNADADPEIARILAKMIAKEPADRYQSCHELAADLQHHPLVMKSGAISLQPKMSTAAATMLGQKTPVSGQRAIPSAAPVRSAETRLTPNANVAPPPMPPAHQSVLDRSTMGGQRKSSALPWAIAALALLAVGGGAYAFRDRIPMLQGVMGTSTSVATTTPATTTPTTAPATPAPPTTTPATNAPTNTAVAVASTTPTSTDTTATASDRPQASYYPRDAATAANDATQADGGPAARASQADVAALRDLPAAQAAENESAVRVAKVTTPDKPVAPPKPHVPTIAVISAGDSAIAEPAQEAISNLLEQHGFRVLDASALPRADRHLHGDRPDFGSALASLSGGGKVDAVIFVHARQVGTQQLQYYGQSSTLYTVQLGVKAYNVNDKRMLGTGWSEQVNFTSLNAADKAREAVGPMLDSVERNLDDYRPNRRRG